VTAVCSTRNQEVARAIGAGHVIDYTREDFTKSARRYDVIIAANGYHSIFAYKRALNPHGTYVVLGGAMLQMRAPAPRSRSRCSTSLSPACV
jgi:NADPH:quinone reductase-like Zn-dependent oxidoreductase